MLTEHLKKLDLSASIDATIAGKKGLKVPFLYPMQRSGVLTLPVGIEMQHWTGIG